MKNGNAAFADPTRAAGPTRAEHLEMIEVIKRTHTWIDSLMVAGVAEKGIVPAMLTALCERHLRASDDVSATVEWLQRHTDMLLALGPQMLDDLRKAHSA